MFLDQSWLGPPLEYHVHFPLGIPFFVIFESSMSTTSAEGGIPKVVICWDKVKAVYTVLSFYLLQVTFTATYKTYVLKHDALCLNDKYIFVLTLNSGAILLPATEPGKGATTMPSKAGFSFNILPDFKQLILIFRKSNSIQSWKTLLQARLNTRFSLKE